MALGTRDNNRENRYSPTYYSAYSSFNTVSKVDPSRLSYSFWNKMLKITITPMVHKGDDNGSISWDRTNAISAYLTHTKAQILANEIRRFLENPEDNNSCGIISNETLITISDGREFGTQGIFLVMRKIAKDTGETLSSYSYQFNTDFHTSVRHYNQSNAKFDLDDETYSDIEVRQLLALLDSYVQAMTGANAYSVIEAIVGERSFRDLTETIENCAKSLGVQVKSPNTPSGGGNVFNQRNRNNNSAPAASANGGIPYSSAEDVEDSLFD